MEWSGIGREYLNGTEWDVVEKKRIEWCVNKLED